MWKSKRRKYLEALLETIRDRQYDLIQKCNEQDKIIVALQQKLLEQQNSLYEQHQQTLHDLKQLNIDNTANIFDRLYATEQNLNYYSMIRSIIDESKYVNSELLLLNLCNQATGKILICGFFGADNLGDELMLQTLLSYFPKEKLSAVTVMLCDNEQYNFYHLPGVNFIHMPKNHFDCNLLAQSFDSLIWGGGALIDDSDFSTQKLTLNNLLINLSKRFIAFNKKVFALGLSTNQSLNNPDFIKELKYVCENSAYFSLRDMYSKKVLEDLGISNTVLLDDLLFFNKAWHKPLPKRNADGTTVIGIVWICYDGFEEKLKSIILAIRKQFKENYKIKLIPFYDCISTDTLFYKRVVESLEYSDDIEIAPYYNDVEEAIKVMAEAEYIINMRYHGMLISSVLGLKALNICYDAHRHYWNKINYLTELFGTNKNLQHYSQLPSNAEDIKLLFSQPDENNNFKLPNADVLKEIINNAIQ